MFDAVLVANRGEIAVRVIRACRELGVRAVAVYSEADRHAPHVRLADEAYLLGPPEVERSYLDIERVVAVAHDAGVDAIHPGYGFLAENAGFADAVTAAGMVFVGPSAAAIRAMGDKLSARAVAREVSVPVVAGTDGPVADADAAAAFAAEHGFPVVIKAMFGGGGRGMKVVEAGGDLAAALDAARRESLASFGRDECYLERYLPRPRHIEVQVLGDLDGTVIHCGDRDCSLQRRHQKLVEEAPAPGLPDDLRAALADAATRIARAMDYTSAGTCEFLVDDLDTDAPTFHFLEMNTRLQVEHPVTELVTGIDLVHAQLRIASGEGLGIDQDDVAVRGHAIEVRINAEDPADRFLPRPGRLTTFIAPAGPGVRVDAGVAAGETITGDYDSMIAKLVVWDADRTRARARMRRALDELQLAGPPTTVGFHRLAMDHEQFVAARHATTSVEHEWDLSTLVAAPQDTHDDASPGGAVGRETVVEIDGRRFALRVFDPAATDAVPRRRVRVPSGGPSVDANVDTLRAPMQGTVVAHAVAEGDAVTAGDVVVVMEAMKMENPVAAHRDGTVTRLHVSPGEGVAKGGVLATIE